MHIRSIIIATVQTVGLFISGLFIPMLTWMVTPVPLILAYVRSSRTDGLAALVLFCLITALLGEYVAFVLGWYVTFLLVVVFGLIAVVSSEGLFQNWKPETSILLSTLFPVAGIGFTAASYFISIGKNPVAFFETYFLGQRDMAAKLYSGFGFNDIASTISSIPDTSIHYFVLLLPCIITLMVATIASCSYIVARAFVVRKPGAGPALAPLPLSSWYAPDTWIWGLVASLALLLIPGETTRFAGWNFVILFATVYFAQGSALVDYFLKEKLHMSSVVRTFAAFIILFLPPLIVSVIALGVMDIWVDFRKLRAPVLKT